LEALLEYDLIGFQTVRDRRNFSESVKRVYPAATRKGRGQVTTLLANGRSPRLGAFPIGIDFRAFAREAAQPKLQEAARDIRSALGDRFLLFGADRLDYTKGVPQRLEALRAAFERYPELRGKICLVQVLVPSREEVPQYLAMKKEIEQLVGEINGRYSMLGWVPVHFRLPQPVPGESDCLLCGGRHGPGHAAAGRHEPGGQGIRRLQHPRNRHPVPERIRRRGHGAAPPRAHGQSL